MNKYEVGYYSPVFGKSNIHVFADSVEEAISIVKSDGIGYSNGRKVYAETITYAKFMDSK